MILSFKTKIHGKTTYFPEKIITGLFQNKIISKDKAIELFYPETLKKLIPMEYHGTKNDVAISKIKFDNSVNHVPKIHTIRKDEKNRWKPGMMIDFFINARQKDMFRFAPRIQLKSKQRIFMTYLPQCGLGFRVSINGRELEEDEIEQLAFNDGFEAVEDFEDYFIAEMENDEYAGKILHWTDFKY